MAASEFEKELILIVKDLSTSNRSMDISLAELDSSKKDAPINTRMVNTCRITWLKYWYSMENLMKLMMVRRKLT